MRQQSSQRLRCSCHLCPPPGNALNMFKRETDFFLLKLSWSGDILHRQSKLHDQLKSYLILPLKPFSHCRLTLDLEIFARLCKIVFKLERRPGWRLTSQQNQIQCILKFFQTVHLSGALSFGRRYGQRIWPCASLGTCAATHRTGLVISSQLSQNWMGQFTWLQPYDLHGQKQVKIPWFPVFRFSQQSSSINDKFFRVFRGPWPVPRSGLHRQDGARSQRRRSSGTNAWTGDFTVKFFPWFPKNTW